MTLGCIYTVTMKTECFCFVLTSARHAWRSLLLLASANKQVQVPHLDAVHGIFHASVMNLTASSMHTWQM